MRLLWRLMAAVTAAVNLGCASGSKKEIKLPLEKESVRESIRGHLGEVSDCYTAALKKNPKLNGKLILEWEVNPIGDPRNVTVVQSVNPKLDQCIAKRLSGWAFTPPPDDKVMRVRYPFVFAKPEEPATETVVTVTGMKKCPQIEAEYAQLCVRDEKTGECALDEKRLTELLHLIQDSPRLTLGYLAELDRLLKNPKPSEPELATIKTKLAEDCWSSIHFRMWKTALANLTAAAPQSRKDEAKAILKERLTVEVPNPTLLGLKMDLSILQNASDAGLISLSKSGKKDVAFLLASADKLRKSLDKDYHDPAQTVPTIRKELKSVKPLRQKLKDWAKKI